MRLLFFTQNCKKRRSSVNRAVTTSFNRNFVLRECAGKTGHLRRVYQVRGFLSCFIRAHRYTASERRADENTVRAMLYLYDKTGMRFIPHSRPLRVLPIPFAICPIHHNRVP